MSPARSASVVAWLYAAGFGISAIPVAIYLRSRGRLPTFFDLFEMYGGPWSSRVTHTTFVWLLLAFLAVNLVVAWSGWLLWNGTRAGAVLNVAILPIEAMFWVGFALPIPWLVGAARVVLVVLAWRSLR